MKKHLWLAAAATLLLSACASRPAPETSPQASAEATAQAIAAAEASVKKANGVGFAWRDSEAMIVQAREAAQKQDFATALKLANGARQQGELAYQQYLDQNATARR